MLAASLTLAWLVVGGAPAASARGAQLEIRKTVSPALMIIGDQAVYTVTVTNTGDAPATGVTVTDTLDPRVTPGTLPAGCSAAGSVVTCGGAGTTIPAGGTISYQIPVTSDPSLADGTNLTNRAKVTSSSAQSQETQLISQTQTSTDVEITKTGPATVLPDGTITYTIVVTNHGPSDAVDVTVQDPTDGNLVSIETRDPACPDSGLTVTCPLGTLTPGESRTLTLVVKPVPGLPLGTSITNCATVYTGSRESDTGNNYSCASTDVGPPSPSNTDLHVTKTGPATVRPGGLISFDVTVTNRGTTAATTIGVDTIDDRITLISVPAGCALFGQVLTCSIVNLAPGESRTYRITGRVDADAAAGGIVNCATATSPLRDALLGNNGACTSTNIVPRPKPPKPRPTPTKTTVKPRPKPHPKPKPSRTPHHACRAVTPGAQCGPYVPRG
ncbi:hypothetical protein GCM10010468_40100 [Actinocorallia longicatena]|uniref:DUF11 domain-containing protein n=1 Tax=Actinocorallia longicatena TaxID=111803 RepID=A0ABP6QE63_9ACTN